MSEQPTDFMRDYQAFAQQSWDTWIRQQTAVTGHPFVSPAAVNAGAAETAPLQPILDGLAAYAGWLRQGLVSIGELGADTDWRAQIEQWLGLPGTKDGAAATATPDPTAWWQQLFAGASAGGEGLPPWFPTFAHDRERQARQQALLQASLECVERGKRYRTMLLQAHVDAVAQLRERLASGELSLLKDDIKGLYSAWVEAAEQAYAAISMSEKFRSVYAGMVNAQMHLHKLQRQQVEQSCREFGMPTRAEFDELARRMHEMRRAWRANVTPPAASAAHSAAADATATKPRQASQAGKTVKSSKSVKPTKPTKPTKPVSAAKPAAKRVTKSATGARSASAKRR